MKGDSVRIGSERRSALLENKELLRTGKCLPYDPSLVERARELRKNMTPAERKLWFEYLREFQYRILRISNQEVLNHFEGVCAKIAEFALER
jgi:very-short-patch-repair endonuclease